MWISSFTICVFSFILLSILLLLAFDTAVHPSKIKGISFHVDLLDALNYILFYTNYTMDKSKTVIIERHKLQECGSIQKWTECCMPGKHCVKCFIYIVLFLNHNSAGKEVLSLPPFYRWGN